MPGFNTQSFIIRIWIEPREMESASIIWRGTAQLVSNGETIIFKSFAELNAFIARKVSIPFPPETGSGAHLEDC